MNNDLTGIMTLTNNPLASVNIRQQAIKDKKKDKDKK